MRFTVLIPTFDHGELIRPAIESVLAQSHTDLELVVVADGSPVLTHDIVREYAARDPRVRLSAHDKGERHGEASRHDVLASSTADAVCYLGDDDFWFPHHLETMSRLLEEADFAHTRLVFLTPTLTIGGYVGDLNDAETRAAMLNQPFNFFGPTVAGHRLDAYRRLPQGWAPAPPDVWTDLHMWRKWLAADGMRLHSSSRVTSIHLPRSARHGIDPALLALEPRTWYEAFKAPAMPVLANVTGQPHSGDPAVIRETMLRQVTESVRWSDCITCAIGAGAKTFVEFGPGKVLSGLIKRIDKTVQTASIQDGASLDVFCQAAQV